MKRFLAAVIILALLTAIPFVSPAPASAETGELLIAQEPETIQAAVGDIVKVNFFLYPNLPDGRKLDSLSGTMKYDPEFVTFATINQEDKEANLTSLMKGKASSFQFNNFDNGELRFAFIDAYGVEAEGFWFQAEFRVEKEGATAFVFNGITYTGIDSSYKTVSFKIEPVSIGGIYTEGYTVPTDGAAGETFAPLTPAVETPVVTTPTPKPSNSGQTVPVSSTLPTYSSVPTQSGIVTPAPAVTSMPMLTPAPVDITPVPQTETTENPVLPDGETTAGPLSTPDASDPQAAEASAFPINGDDIFAETTSEPGTQNDPVEGPESDTKNAASQNEEKNDDSDRWLIIGIIAGMVAVVGLGALAIILLLKRRKMNEQE